MTKYCNDEKWGIVDDKLILEPEDDVAHVRLKGGWRMPTDSEFQELIENTTSRWVEQNGVVGRLFVSKATGESIFLPASGYVYGLKMNHNGEQGRYRSSSLYLNQANGDYQLYFTSDITKRFIDGRDGGANVRPVQSK